MFVQHKQKGESMLYDNINFLKLEHIRNDIQSIETYSLDNIVYAKIILKSKHYSCPLCGSSTHINGYFDKKIIHSTLTHSKSVIIYHARRFICKSCGKRFFEHNPFSSKHDSISSFTKLEVLNALKNHNATYTSIAARYNISIKSVINIFDSFVECARKPLPEVLCIDEIFTAKISAYKFACVWLDFNTNEIIDILPTRQKNYLRYHFERISKNEREKVKYVVIDMYETYKETALICLPNALVAIDSFHVIRHINEAVKRVRIDIMNKYKNHKTFNHNDDWYYMLKKFHYFFVKDYGEISNKLIKIHKYNVSWSKSEIRSYLLSIDDDLKYAYELKEEYRYFNRTAIIRNELDKEYAIEKLSALIYKFRNSKFDCFRRVGKMLNSWSEYIINSFYHVNKRRLSNGPIEGMNSKIKTIIKVSNGMRNFHRFRNRCMYSLNKNTPIKNL
jgi:Transposase and inactivated derivatives